MIWVLGTSALALHCGARSPLYDLERVAPDAGDPDASFFEAASDSDSDAEVDASPDADLAPACVLTHATGPTEVFALPGSDLHTPSMVVLSAGEAALGQPARVALQAIGGDSIQLVSLTVTLPEPGLVAIDTSAPTALGGGTTYGQMVHAPEGLEQLALVWGADGPGNEFRTVDIPTWTPGPLVQVAQIGWTPNGLAAGKGVPNTQSGQYEGPGYGMTWQAGTGEAPHMAVLSAKGEILVGPLSPAKGVASELLESTMSWSGSTYLMATRFGACSAGDPFCAERSVVVTRLRVKPGSNSIELASSIQAADGWSPGHPTLDGVHLVFDEAPDTDGPHVVHVEELSQEGVLVGTDHVVSSSARPIVRPILGSKPGGWVVGWAEDGDATLPDATLGRSRLVFQGLGSALELEGTAVALGITRFRSMGRPVAVPVQNPRGVLVVWSGRSQTSSYRVIFADFLPCTP